MSVRTCLRMAKGRIALVVVLFLLSISIAPRHLLNAYAQDINGLRQFCAKLSTLTACDDGRESSALGGETCLALVLGE